MKSTRTTHRTTSTSLGSLLRNRRAKRAQGQVRAERRQVARRIATHSLPSDVGLTVPYRDAPR